MYNQRSYIVLAQDNWCLYMYLILEFLGTTWDLKYQSADKKTEKA